MDKFLIKLNKSNQPGSSQKNASSSKSQNLFHQSICNEEVEDTDDSEVEVGSENNLDENENEMCGESRQDTACEIPIKKRKTYVNDLSKLKKQFCWLDSSKRYLFCILCNVKISGQKYHITRHSSSTVHQKNERAAKITPKISTIIIDPAKERKQNLIKEAELRYCAYLCEHNLAFLLADSLPLFCKSIYHDSEIAAGVKLKRRKLTRLIAGVIAPYIKKEIAADLKKNVFSIIIDETTDVGTQKSLVVIVRYWKDGVIRDRIFDLIQVLDATAQSIFNSVKELLDNNGIPYQNIIGFAADNASTMMGNLNGVKMKLKELSPDIFVQGCSSHSLHLCTSAAARKLPNTVEQFTRDIYTYFSHSSKRLEELAECQVFADEKPRRMLYPSQTRWLSLRAVVTRILEHWNSLTLFFTRAAIEDQLPVAKSILGALKNDIFKIYLLFLSFVLELVTKVNLEFQSEQPKLPILLDRITTLYKILLKCFIQKSILDDVPIC